MIGKKKNKTKLSVKLVLDDSKILKGELIGIDKHMNIVLQQAKEFRNTNINQWEARLLGVCLIRGDSITSFSFESKKI